jgi:hypothetical protein
VRRVQVVAGIAILTNDQTALILSNPVRVGVQVRLCRSTPPWHLENVEDVTNDVAAQPSVWEERNTQTGRLDEEPAG